MRLRTEVLKEAAIVCDRSMRVQLAELEAASNAALKALKQETKDMRVRGTAIMRHGHGADTCVAGTIICCPAECDGHTDGVGD